MLSYQTFGTRIFNNHDVSFSQIPINGNWIWLDAADASSVSMTNGAVTEWRDKSPNKYTFSRPDADQNNMPSYNSTTLNNLPTVSFYKDNNQYLIGDRNDFSIGFNSFYLFVVFKFNDIDTSYFQGVFNKSYFGGIDGRIAFYKGYLAGGMVLDISQPESTTGSPFGMSDISFNMFSLICHRNTSGPITSTSTINQNGTQLTTSNTSFEVTPTTGTSAPTNLPNIDYMFVGAYNSDDHTSTPYTNSYFHGSIAEIIGYSTPQDMSTLNIQKVEGYLANKWGLTDKLPVEHPYKNTSPPI
jgi:hypothetical protein